MVTWLRRGEAMLSLPVFFPSTLSSSSAWVATAPVYTSAIRPGMRSARLAACRFLSLDSCLSRQASICPRWVSLDQAGLALLLLTCVAGIFGFIQLIGFIQYVRSAITGKQFQTFLVTILVAAFGISLAGLVGLTSM